MQLPNARRAAVQNMGGVGTANYVNVLSRYRGLERWK